ncbi:hypothetical protein C8F01DRAFT_1247867 [Mycena amicta]|nr:hypothetical protein C8F01DRAFT_1247867 [Mycena amicta]
MLEIAVLGRPRFESLTPRVNLQLVSLKLTSWWLSDPSTVMKQLGVARLDLYSQRKSTFIAPDLEELLAVHGPTLRSLTIPFELTGSYNLIRCTRLERLQLEVFPDEAGILAIPLGVVTIAVGPPSTQPNVDNLIARLPSACACKELGIEFRIHRGNLSDDHVEYELRRKLLTS